MKLNQILEGKKIPGANLQRRNLKELPDDIPTVLNRDFNCQRNALKSLKGAPKTVIGIVDISANQIASLEYFPTIIHSKADISNNNISSFDGLVGCRVGGGVDIGENRFTSLKGIEKAFIEISGELWIKERNKYQIKGYALGLLKIKNLVKCKQWGIKDTEFDKALVIINKYLENKSGPICSNAEIFHCANELDDLGLTEYSKL